LNCLKGESTKVVLVVLIKRGEVYFSRKDAPEGSFLRLVPQYTFANFDPETRGRWMPSK